MFAEIAEVFLTHEMFEAGHHQTEIKTLHRIVLDSLLPKYILCTVVFASFCQMPTEIMTPW